MSDTIAMRTRSMRKFFVAPSNGMRLSCGAEQEYSQIEDYPRKRGAVSFRRLLGRSLISCSSRARGSSYHESFLT